MVRAAWLSMFVLLAACQEAAATAVEIPSQVHGTFGRDPSDLELGTLGLEIDAKAIRLSQMTITVTEGKLVGDTFHIGRAEVRWEKDDAGKLPKECKGTLARQGSHMLVSLFRKDSDEPCESILKGEWLEWQKTSEFPEAMRGVFGGTSTYASDFSFTVAANEIRADDEPQPLVLKEAVRFVDRDSELFVRDARVGETVCKGTIEADGDELSGALGDCAPLHGTRWHVQKSAIPSGALKNGKVVATFADDRVTLENDGDTKCEQRVLRTTPRPTTDRGRDRIPVLAGQVLLLEQAEPKGASACGKRMQNLYQAECRARYGAPCPEDELPAVEIRCPTHLIVGDPTPEGRKMALLPEDVATVACFDMTGHFEET